MRPTTSPVLKSALCLLLPLLCLPGPSAHAQDDNKGGKLLINTNHAWYADSLLFDSFNGRPVLNQLKPVAGKTFLVVSTQISIDWTGFPKASQFHQKEVVKDFKLP
jgi:hypothetical protein